MTDHLRGKYMMTIHRYMKTYYSIVVDVITTEYRQAGKRANAFEMNAHIRGASS